MASPDDPSDCHPGPAAAARARRLSVTAVAILVGLALNLALCVRRVGHDDRGALAFVGVSHLNLLLLFVAIRRFELSPPGSVARGRARLAVWLLTTTLTAGFTWKIGALLPPALAIVAWVMAAGTVLAGVFLLFVHDDK
ncbi:hypothetical protein U9M48_029759 [Paspalum notatum var. saurae]|uniref:Uncharacterized protein n=1 Tax=Paspalum notatum var. saurae TaxID=547442 RepID=A0AAQ3U3M5_PASNO